MVLDSHTVKVLKFGGTSVGSIERIQNVAQIVKRRFENEGPLCVVASAMSGETDRLVGLYKTLSEDTQTFEYDLLVASGEQASVALLATALNAIGVKSRALLGYQAGFVTNTERGRAKIQHMDTSHISQICSEGFVPVVAGFQGADDKGYITTLGRGGSDTSAVALAAALKADLCDIYTDVSGVYTADPRICPNAKRIEHMSFEEMMELASLGAKVLHPRSVEIAAKYNTVVRVLNTFEASKGNTMGTTVGPINDLFESPVVTALTTDKNLALFTLRDLQESENVLDRLFTRLSQEGVIVDIIVHSAVHDGGRYTLSFSTPKDDIRLVEKSLNSLDLKASQVDTDLVKVSLVGTGMRSHSGVAARVFQILSQNKIKIVCTTTSEIKISCVVPASQAETALRTLHDEFIP
jgi:aspartate kinase